jgi:hypothetical protein
VLALIISRVIGTILVFNIICSHHLVAERQARIILARIVRALEKPTQEDKYAETLAYKLLAHVLNDEELANKLA